MSSQFDVEKANGDDLLPRSKLSQLLKSLESSVRLVGKTVMAIERGQNPNRWSDNIFEQCDNDLEDVSTAIGSASSEYAHTFEPIANCPEHSLEDWWTASTTQADSASHDIHPWHSPNLSCLPAHLRFEKVFNEFERWLIGYCRCTFVNPTPFLSLILYRLEADALVSSKSEAEGLASQEELAMEADTKLELVSILIATFQLASGNETGGGIWELRLGTILHRCYTLGALRRPASFDETEIRNHLSRVIGALALFDIRAAHGPLGSVHTHRSPHSLRIDQIFSTAGNQPSVRQNVQSSDTFSSTNLSLESLIAFGGIKVVWTEFLSDHLSFDVGNNLLSIYWFGGTARTKWLNGNSLNMDNVHLRNTYALLFPVDAAGAKSAYRTYWRLQPPYWICHYYSKRCTMASGCSSWGQLRALFPRAMQRGEDIWSHIGLSTYRDAPIEKIQLFESYGIYADRLRVLDAHMMRWKPRGLLGLWRDNRDSYQWWTLWALIVVGGLALLVSILALGVAIAQLVAALR